MTLKLIDSPFEYSFSLDHIPVDALDHYFFQELVPQLEPPLRPLATDPAVVIKSPHKPTITTLAEIVINGYTITPWILNDSLPAGEEAALIVGQAHIPVMMSFVIMDNIVDGQMEGWLTLPLLPQFYLLKAAEKFGELFPHSEPFWEQYYARFAEWGQGLALESDCLSAHNQPYDWAAMRRVCTAKAAPLRNAAYALAASSGRLDLLPTIDEVLNLLLFADQLSDDARDWRDDYHDGRYTLPVYLALTAEGDSWDAAPTVLTEKALDARLKKHQLLIKMTDEAIATLETARQQLGDAGLSASRLAHFINDRLTYLSKERRMFQAGAFFNALARSLDPADD